MARINLGKVVPEKGVDYYTEAEKTELKQEIENEMHIQEINTAIQTLQTDSGHTIEMTVNANYQIVLTLKNKAGTVISTATIDLPNENAVTGISYNNGKLTVTKQSGASSEVDISGLIEGLVTESDFNTFKTELEETIGAINVKNEEQDEAIEENYKVINKLKEQIADQQMVIDQMPHVEGEGYEVQLKPTINAKMSLLPYGHSEQETTEGKQLIGIADKTYSTNGLTANMADGILAISGTANANSFIRIDNKR